MTWSSASSEVRTIIWKDDVTKPRLASSLSPRDQAQNLAQPKIPFTLFQTFFNFDGCCAGRFSDLFGAGVGVGVGVGVAVGVGDAAAISPKPFAPLVPRHQRAAMIPEPSKAIKRIATAIPSLVRLAFSFLTSATFNRSNSGLFFATGSDFAEVLSLCSPPFGPVAAW